MCTVIKHRQTADDSYIIRFLFLFHRYAASFRRKEGEGMQQAACFMTPLGVQRIYCIRHWELKFFKLSVKGSS